MGGRRIAIMPELPDVEVFGDYLEAHALRQRIEAVTVSDTAILDEGTSPQSLGRRLAGRRLEGTRRHGKNLFARISREGGWLRLHFGMTGKLAYGKDGSEEPPHTRFRMDFENGRYLAFQNQRKLGRVSWVRSIDEWVDERSLGPDALEVDLDAFRERLGGRKGSVKGTLMDQGVIAGLGNVYTDEILFQAGLHPRTPVQDLEEGVLRDLFETMKRVIRRAIEARVEDFPDDFLVPHRNEGEACPRCGTPLERIEVVGRGTYLCPKEQPEPS
jgi:formamidopyrimidine-DNA glycosylase